MELPSYVVESALAKIRELRGGNQACPSCGKNQWSLSNRVFEVETFTQFPRFTTRPMEVSVMPLLALACTHCHHQLFFNALSLGVVDPKGGLLPLFSIADLVPKSRG